MAAVTAMNAMNAMNDGPFESHGGVGPALAARLGVPVDAVLDLSASLNPLAVDPEPIVAAHLRAVTRYPQPQDVAAAAGQLAEVMGVDPDCLVLTNGGAEAIALVASVHPKGSVEEPEFSLYRRHLETVDPAGPRWRSNPHNPTGRLAAPGDRAAVWDEAFWPLAAGTWTRGDAQRDSSLVVGSLTKLLACPGLRIGYVLCPDADQARAIGNRQPQWAVNGLAVASLPDLLATVRLAEWAAGLARLRAELVDVLVAAGLAPRPSDANWVLVDEGGGRALRDRLADRAIAVRGCESFGLPGVVRIAVPDRVGLQRLKEAL